MSTIDLLIASPNEQIFSGKVNSVIVRSESGELGIFPKHTALLSRLIPGSARYHVDGEAKETVLFVAGGIVEVLPDKVSILADEFKRSEDLDEKLVIKLKEEAEKELEKHEQGTVDYNQALSEVNMMVAQLNILKLLKK